MNTNQRVCANDRDLSNFTSERLRRIQDEAVLLAGLTAAIDCLDVAGECADGRSALIGLARSRAAELAHSLDITITDMEL